LAAFLFIFALPGQSALAASQHEAFSQAIANFEKLGQDKVKSTQRQPWEKVEADFARIRNGKGSFAAEAFFYQARSREELADRSKSRADWQEAIRLYSRMAQEYPRNALADNAMYNQAMLLSGPLGDKAAAVKVLDQLLMQYPDSDMAAEANILRERLENNGAFVRRNIPVPASAVEDESAAERNAASQNTTAQSASTTYSAPAAAAPAAAAQKPKPAGQAATNTPKPPKPTAAAQTNQRKQYESAAETWRGLISGKNNRAGHRDVWENLEKNFLKAEQTAPGGSYADKSAYQAARCRAELADRSKSGADWREAVALYATVAEKYPASSLADDALYRRAEILADHTDQPAEAKETAMRILSRYPNGDMQSKANALLARLGNGSPSGAVAAQSSENKPSAAQTSGGSTQISGSSGNQKAAAQGSGGLLRHLSWQGDKNKFTLTIEFSGKAKYRRATLPARDSGSGSEQAGGSGRIQLDFLSSVLDKSVRKNLEFSGLPVSAITMAQADKNTARLVLDLGQARSYKVSALYNPYRIRVEVSAASMLAGGIALDKAGSARQTSGAASGSKPVSTGASGSKPAGSLVEQLGLSIKTVAIDAGHGGKDPGAVGNGITESRYTLDLAKALGQRLQQKGFKVIYTRSDNRYQALKDRTTFANERKADILISLHVNSSTNKKLSGVETYYLDAARSDAASVVAARENAVDVKATSDLQFILSDLTRNSKRDESRTLAGLVQQNTLSQLRRGGFSVKDNGVRSAPFFVLMGAKMPAFLFEVGYLSNSSDVARLKNKKYLSSLADGIAAGIVAYRNKINSM
jgi:N-acetylmuramoyl-L-alanine amidase